MAQERGLILVLENDCDIADVLSMSLDSQGYSIHCRQLYENTVCEIREEVPSLVIVGLSLGRTPYALDVIQALGSRDDTRDTPILVMATLNSVAQRALVFPNVRGVIELPFELHEFEQRIRTLLPLPPDTP